MISTERKLAGIMGRLQCKTSAYSDYSPSAVRGPGFMAVNIGYYSQRVWDMDGKNRADIKPGAHVRIVQKRDQRSGNLTEGIVLNILTNSPTHPHGVKVRLINGVVGRVKEILPDGLDPVRFSIAKV
jgi:uncharacterized repeat protein (TIGR03833 family)